MGYPTWAAMSSASHALVRSEGGRKDLAKLDAAAAASNFPAVFEESARVVGLSRLIQHLRSMFPSTGNGKVYENLARWPVPVYLTTNFEHEISKHLTAIGESYQAYSNSEDHLSLLLPDTYGAIVHLHGDLRSETGLILTQSQYHAIAEGDHWAYWRTKLTSIFQMIPVIVVGHSLTDPHVRHVLEAARQGAKVMMPVCWIAPDVSVDASKEYLENYRIRVISYDNRDGSHRNLVNLVKSISDFVPPRDSIPIRQSLARVSESPLGGNAAAPGFFVFNKLAAQTSFDGKRVDVVAAAISAALPQLQQADPFTLAEALELVGWPPSLPMSADLQQTVGQKLVVDGVLLAAGDRFSIAPGAVAVAAQEKGRFDHLRDQFNRSLQLRLRSTFPALSDDQVTEVARDIEDALTGFFREGGLTLASTLSATATGLSVTVPASVVTFINEASARYPDHLRRQAFSTVSLDAFVRSNNSERNYLGRISQGFFAFHLLGVFGDAAAERIKHARETVWLVDSSAQIPAVALGAPANNAFRSAFNSVRQLGIRLFSTEKLFDETREHLWFADRVIQKYGVTSPYLIAAAEGHAPYRKANVFLEGFIAWQAAGNPADWGHYMYAIGGHVGMKDALVRAVSEAGIEIVPFSDWPGFVQEDHAEADVLTETVVAIYHDQRDQQQDFYQKARPEAEALFVAKSERDGKYHMVSEEGVASPAWFLSETSILNSVHVGRRITWTSEAFVRFASTLGVASDQESADRAFDMLLWSLAQAGVSVLDDRVAVDVFGGVIDQARLTVTEERAAYDSVLGEKYGEPIQSVLDQVPRLQLPLVALQLANERAVHETALRNEAQNIAGEAVKRAKVAEERLKGVERYRRKQEQKRQKHEKRVRKAKSSAKKSRRRRSK